jgi:hypothetical protein
MVTLRDLVGYGWSALFGLDAVAPATFTVPAGDPVSVGSNRTEQWQRQAWTLWAQVGELHYPTTRLSRQTAQLEWRVRVNGRQLFPDAAKREIEAITAGMGPQEATYLLALNDQVSGEAWYIETEPGKFAVYSVIEKDLDKKIASARASGRIAIRSWQTDPTNPEKADSSVRTAIGPAEEVLTYQALSQGQARSRLSQAGIIVTPAEQLYAAEDPWEANLLEAMTNAIRDVKSPSALAPIHIRMRRDLIDTVRYITFPRPYDDLIDRKIERAVIRIANALDIEPELIQGIGDSTYWNAWAVSMDTYQAHIAPRAARIGSLYAEVSERLRRAANPESTVTVEITPDPRVMLARRSSVRDAMDAYKLGIVGPAYVLESIGATDADAPTDEEFERLLQILSPNSEATMDRERRVGENPGPARSSPENSAGIVSNYEVAAHARKVAAFKLREAWRNTPHRNRLSGIHPSDFACWIPMDDVAREMPLVEVIADAVREVATADNQDRLVSWVMETLTTPIDSLKAMEVLDHA